MKITRKHKKKIRRPGIPGLMNFCRAYGCCRTHAWKVLSGRRESFVLKRAFAEWKKKQGCPSTLRQRRIAQSDVGTSGEK